MTDKDWPYPFWIAHRGAGTLAPENTLAAFRVGLAHGFRMFECDAQLSADGVVFFMHDQTLDRTTDGSGDVSGMAWKDIASLDAGLWHGAGFAGERIPTLAEVAAFCQSTGACVNIEIKSAPEQEATAARSIARQAQALWREQARVSNAPAGPVSLPTALIPPFLTSFSVAAIRAVQEVAPELPRGLLLEDLSGDWQLQAQQLGCHALVFDRQLLNASLVAVVQAMGMRCLAYTVNDPSDMEALIAAGIDGLITDEMRAPSLGSLSK
jgi:glycerophosphoryl diester phosphodiesterase